MKNEKEESYRKGLQDAYKDILKLIYRDGYTAEQIAAAIEKALNEKED